MFLADIFREALFRPLFNLLVSFYDFLPGQDFGIAIIAVTILVRLLLIPISLKGTKMQAVMQKIRPEIQQIQKKYKKDREKQARAMMEIYRKHKVNPLSGLLPILIQLPIIIAIYRVFLVVLDPSSMNLLYDFVPQPGPIDPFFLGVVDLSTPNLPLALVTGLAALVQSKIMLSFQGPQKPLHKQLAQKKGKLDTGDIGKVMGRQMAYIMPGVTVLIAATLPAGIAIYWLTTTIFGVGEFWFIRRKHLAEQYDVAIHAQEKKQRETESLP